MGGFRGPIPRRLDWLKETNRGQAWLAAVPAAVDESAEHWGLRLDEPFDERVVHPFVDHDPAGGSAALTGRAEAAPQAALNRQVEVSVVEHDHWILAAKFE